MENMWQRMLADESGLVISSELAMVGTLGVLSMVVGLNAVSCSVNSELNDLASAFGAIDQSYNFRSISKAGHARASGSGFNDNGDFCDCVLISQNDVAGQSGQSGTSGFSQAGGSSQSLGSQVTVLNSAPIQQERIIEERVIDEAPAAITATDTHCTDDDIIEEHIIRRRIRADCDTTMKRVDCDTTTKVVPQAKTRMRQPDLQPAPEKIEVKPQKKK